METLGIFVLFCLLFISNFLFRSAFPSLHLGQLSVFISYSHNTPTWVYCSTKHREMPLFISFSILLLLRHESLFIPLLQTYQLIEPQCIAAVLFICSPSLYLSPFQTSFHMLKEVENAVDFIQILSSPSLSLQLYFCSINSSSIFPHLEPCFSNLKNRQEKRGEKNSTNLIVKSNFYGFAYRHTNKIWCKCLTLTVLIQT